MKRLIPVILILILISAPVCADDLQDDLDPVSRFKLWEPRAEKGGKVAQHILGSFYENGHGAPQDYVQAHKWFNIASMNGDGDYRKSRDNVQKLMTPAQIAEAQKLAREWVEEHGKE